MRPRHERSATKTPWPSTRLPTNQALRIPSPPGEEYAGNHGKETKWNTVEQVNKLSKELEQWLRMRVHPIAVKFLKSQKEVPEGAIIPTRDWEHKYSLCQAFARAQRNGETIAMFKEDHWCFEPVLGLGLAERSAFFIEGHHRYPDSVRDLKAAAEWCRNMPHLPYDEYKGMVCAPAHVLQLHARCDHHARERHADQPASDREDLDRREGRPISALRACGMRICHGARFLETRSARSPSPARETGVWPGLRTMKSCSPSCRSSCPTSSQGIHWLQDHNWGLPMIQEYKEEYDLKPKYKELGEKLGLDLRQSPPRKQKLQKY